MSATTTSSTFGRPAYVHTDAEIDWRKSRVSRLGAGDELAASIAASDVDIHDVEQLLGRGCPLDVAFEVLR